MTIATDRGFVVGQHYAIKGDYNEDGSRFLWKFYDDDDSCCPMFMNKFGHTSFITLDKFEQPELPVQNVENVTGTTTFNFNKRLTYSQVERILAIAAE